LYFASTALKSFITASGSPAGLFHRVGQAVTTGSADFFHSASCASVSV